MHHKEHNSSRCFSVDDDFILSFVYSIFTLELCFDSVVFFLLQHTRFVQECKDAEPDVLFVGDSMVQLMQQFDVSLLRESYVYL